MHMQSEQVTSRKNSISACETPLALSRRFTAPVHLNGSSDTYAKLRRGAAAIHGDLDEPDRVFVPEGLTGHCVGKDLGIFDVGICDAQPCSPRHRSSPQPRQCIAVV